MSNDLKVGDSVEVLCPGLAMLRKITNRPEGSNNHGVVAKIWSNGDILVCFPIGGADIDEHSQVAPYPPRLVKKLEE